MCFQRHLDLKQALIEHRKPTPQGTYLQDHSVERTFAQSDGEM